MIALLFGAYGAVYLAALVAFLVWASAAKLRPDLDEEELDLADLEKLKKMVSSGRSAETLDRAAHYRRAVPVATDRSGQAEQAFAPKGSKPVPYPQAARHLALNWFNKK